MISFQTKDLGDGVYCISTPKEEQTYLVVGAEKAALIDTGSGIGSLRAEAEKITSLPLVVILTHGHPDHGGGAGEFKDCPVYLSDYDRILYRQMCSKEYREDDIRKNSGDQAEEFIRVLLPDTVETADIAEGNQIDLGGRSLAVWNTPGHTRGSICLYDRQSRMLFGGDMLTDQYTWMHLWCCCSMETYLESVRKLQNLNLDLRCVLAGHLPMPVDKDIIGRKVRCASRILEHPEAGKPIQTFAGDGMIMESDGTSILYNPDYLHN